MDASRAESRDQACRLRVMEDGDVTGTDDLSESSRVAGGGLLILAPVLLGQRRAIRVGSLQLRHIWENAVGRLRYATSATRSSSPTSSDIAPSSSVATERASSRERCAGERPSKTSRTGSPSVRFEIARTTPPSCGAGAPSA